MFSLSFSLVISYFPLHHQWISVLILDVYNHETLNFLHINSSTTNSLSSVAKHVLSKSIDILFIVWNVPYLCLNLLDWIRNEYLSVNLYKINKSCTRGQQRFLSNSFFGVRKEHKHTFKSNSFFNLFYIFQSFDPGHVRAALKLS